MVGIPLITQHDGMFASLILCMTPTKAIQYLRYDDKQLEMSGPPPISPSSPAWRRIPDTLSSFLTYNRWEAVQIPTPYFLPLPPARTLSGIEPIPHCPASHLSSVMESTYLTSDYVCVFGNCGVFWIPPSNFVTPNLKWYYCIIFKKNSRLFGYIK